MIIHNNEQYLSWQDVEECIITITNDIKYSLKDPHKYEIVTVTRGGMIPAAMLAHRLDIKKIWVITKELLHEPIMNVTMADSGTKLLFVDDIYDTGKTWAEMKTLLYGYDVNPCFLVMKFAPKDIPQPFFTGVTLFANRWVVFPWEVSGKTGNH